jgi:glycerophosphoryl diester phosphodiesterase
MALSAQIQVIVHRGEHLHNPENTINATRGAIAADADFVELDVRTTRDGPLVLMHEKEGLSNHQPI